MRLLSSSAARAAAPDTPPESSAATARARRARRNLPKLARAPAVASPPMPASPPMLPPTTFVEKKKSDDADEFDDPDFFAVDPEVIPLDPGSAAAVAAAADASGSVVVISSSSTTKKTAQQTAKGADARSRAAALDARLSSMPRRDVDSRTDLLMALATSGTSFDQVLEQGIAQGLIDELTLRLLERRLSAARASVGEVGNSGTNPEEELAAVRGLAVIWSRLRSEVERQRAPPAERAIDDALRELAAAAGSGGVGGGPSSSGRERAEKVLRRAAGLSGFRSSGGGGGGSGGGIDILAFAAASELDPEEVEDIDPSFSASANRQIVPAAVISATCSSLIRAAQRQVDEVERALRAAKEMRRKSSSSSSSSSSAASHPSFGRAERLAADRRDLVAALREVLDIVNGL